MQPHEEEAVADLRDLQEKIGKLGNFISKNPIYDTVHEDEKVRLRMRYRIMEQLEAILAESIDHFPKESSATP
jgi:hypothetical protein